MRLHINFITIGLGLLIPIMAPHVVGLLVGVIFVAHEIYRCHRIASLTSDFPADTILDFYRSDSARRYYSAGSTAKELRKFYESTTGSA